MPSTAAVGMQAAPLNILDLPLDVLAKIFGHLHHVHFDTRFDRSGWFMSSDAATKVQQTTTKNARLVCQAFYKLATPCLFPVLKLSLEPTSMDMMESLSKNATILASIRVVEISASYRPSKLANDRELFAKHRVDGMRYYSDYDSMTLANFLSMCAAWGQRYESSDQEMSDDEADDEEEDEQTREYRRILEKSHAEYRQRHEEQLELIVSGRFVQAVADLVSKIPNLCSLEFHHASDRYRSQLFDTTRIFTDTNELYKFMLSPDDWTLIEDLITEHDLTPALVLATLPIAIQRQGSTLQGIGVRCFPRRSGNFGFCGSSQDLLWDEFAVCCKQLKSFDFYDNCKDYRSEHPQDEDKACIDRYFGAMLSSPHLENLRLDCYSFELSDEYRGRTLNGMSHCINMGSAISTTQYTLLEKARISSISVRQNHLERFCDGLGNKLRSLDFYNIEMYGEWVNVLEILGEKYAARGSEGRCQITLRQLFGGEFGWRPRKRPINPRSILNDEGEIDQLLLFKQQYPEHERQRLIDQSEQYVNGSITTTENPLKPT